ncbi:MAG: hypothetical protein EZS28_049795, partial [Streblomastix strix]
IHDTGREQRSVSTRRKNEEIEKAPTPRKVDSRVDRGNRGEELFRWVLGKRGFSNTAIQKVIGGWHTIWGRHRQRLGQFDEYWKSIGKSREDLLIESDPETMISNFISQLQADQTSDANQANCRTAIAMLFRAQGVPKDKINGFALQQIMKKPQAGMRQKIKEEPVWQYNDLLRYVNEKATAKQDLSENQYMGIVIALIMGYSTLRLAEVHRSIVKDLKDGSWQINTSMIKVHETQVEIVFRPVQNPNVCPTEWIRGWYERRTKKDKNKPFLWLIEKKRIATYEEASKAVHQIMAEAGIPDNPAVTSIRKSSMTKSIDQGATKTQINRATRHKKGTDTVAHHYDKNLNDNLRQRLSEFE